MTDRLDRNRMTDDGLGAALRELSRFVAVPATGGAAAAAIDPARVARLRIEAGAGRATRSWRDAMRAPRLGRGFAFALLALVVIAAAAGAIGLGLPGIRIVQAPTGSPFATNPQASASPTAGQPTATPPPSIARALGDGLGLGDPITMTDAATAGDLDIVLPTAPGIPAPAAVWLLDGRLTFVWPTSSTLPATAEPGIGLLLSEFRGSLDPGYFEKVIGQGTSVTTVQIGDDTGYWISGAPHEIVYVNANGDPVFDSQRSVGDTLLWTRGDVTYRLESGLGRAGAIAVAGSLR